MNSVETYQESRMICPGCFCNKISLQIECFVWGVRNAIQGGKNSMECYVRCDKSSMGCFVHGGKSLRDVLSRVSKMAWDVFSQDVLSGSRNQILLDKLRIFTFFRRIPNIFQQVC